MTSSWRKVVCMFRIKFPTKPVSRIFPILRTVWMAPFWNLFMERPSYILTLVLIVLWLRVICAMTEACIVCRFIGMTAVTHGGMMKWQSRHQNVNRSGLMLKIHSSCSIQGSYDDSPALISSYIFICIYSGISSYGLLSLIWPCELDVEEGHPAFKNFCFNTHTVMMVTLSWRVEPKVLCGYQEL